MFDRINDFYFFLRMKRNCIPSIVFSVRDSAGVFSIVHIEGGPHSLKLTQVIRDEPGNLEYIAKFRDS